MQPFQVNLEPLQVNLEPPEKQPADAIRVPVVGGIWDGHVVDTHPMQPAHRFRVRVPQEDNEATFYEPLGPGEFVHGPRELKYRTEEYRLAEFQQPLVDGFARRYRYYPEACFKDGNLTAPVPASLHDTPQPLPTESD